MTSIPKIFILFFIPKDYFAGTKLDLRDEAEPMRALQAEGKSPISKTQGMKMAQKIKAVKYLECSALTQQGLTQVIFYLKL